MMAQTAAGGDPGGGVVLVAGFGRRLSIFWSYLKTQYRLIPSGAPDGRLLGRSGLEAAVSAWRVLRLAALPRLRMSTGGY